MRKLKIFNHVWHVGHQASLIWALEGAADFDWLIQHRRPFNTQPRGELPVTEVPHYEPGKYDLALLHLDQQCLDDEIWRRGKGRLYRELNEVITDIPKVVINHGTPYWPEKFSADELKAKMRSAIGDNTMVVNSLTAAKQWGWGTPIIHGLDPAGWWDLPKERRVVTMVSPAGLDMYYDRQFLAAVKERLEEDGIGHCHITVDWQAKDFNEYRDFLGRSLVYFNPTRESPMPRARTEAMLSGCCVVTTPHQDASDFIEDGVNGFLVKRDPDGTAELIKSLLSDYDRAVAIGQRGKRTATERFHIDRYRADWLRLLSGVLNKEVTPEGVAE